MTFAGKILFRGFDKVVEFKEKKRPNLLIETTFLKKPLENVFSEEKNLITKLFLVKSDFTTLRKF